MLAACLVYAAFFTAAAQGDLCSDIKGIVAQYVKDKNKLMGTEKSKDDMMSYYTCPFKLTGAASIETRGYTSLKAPESVLGYYATDIKEADSKKQFAALVEKLKQCYPDAKKGSDDDEGEEYQAREGKCFIYLTRFNSKTDPDTYENFYSIHIQIMFYD